ncbi:hypothetical protein OF001_U370002 [Pseudomonas sp. OF001]|nr:hypothetical protein OF001_U370002 [Pseudomonas sp. OF001]
MKRNVIHQSSLGCYAPDGVYL